MLNLTDNARRAVLVRAFKSIENLKNAAKEDLIALENVGEITAEAIVNWFQDKENLAEINNLPTPPMPIA